MSLASDEVALVMHGKPVERDAAHDFEEFFRAILPRAIGVGMRILGGEHQAEDAAAEALARAHASWHKVGRMPYRDAWILRVTANVAVDMTRRQRRVFPGGLRIGDERAHHDEPDESRAELAAALAALPRRQREIMVLRYLESMTEPEVAAALGISDGTVKKNAFRARETLRRRLGYESFP